MILINISSTDALPFRVTDQDGNSRSAGEAYSQAQEAKEQAKSQARDQKNVAKDQAGSHGGDVASARNPNDSYMAQAKQMKGAVQDKANQADQNTPDIDSGDAKNKARGKAEDLKNRIPEEQRQKVHSAVGQTKDIVKDAFPEERREQFIYRLKKVIASLHKRRRADTSR